MKNAKAKNKTALFLVLILSAGCFGSCFLNKGDSSVSESSKEETVDPLAFDTLYESKSTVKLNHLQETEFTVHKEIGDKNYLRIELLTDVNLVGYIHYTDVDNPAKTHKEKIYIEQGATEFTMFLDAFRKGAFGDFSKKLEKITLQNVSEQEGAIRVTNIAVSGRTYDTQEMLYINNGKIKLGAWLAAGGSICHVERLGEDVVEYIDENGSVCIDKDVDASKVRVVTEEVNLINIHDLGREIQQSYYANVNESHGYAPTDTVLYEGSVLYNPVQAGSAGDKQTQIIDYSYTDTEIRVKVRPQDWFFNNTQSDSYMENVYTFGENGVLMVYNRFVNFSQFRGMEKAWISGQETPAVYAVYPLNYFYCETTDGVIKDPNLSPMMTSNKKTCLNESVSDPYCYELSKNKVPDDWVAFVNENNFGIGIYTPNADAYCASRGSKSIWYEMVANHSYHKGMYDLKNYKYIPSAYADNYNYCGSPVIRRMVDFVPFEYEYAIDVGTVDEMRKNFRHLTANQTIKNNGFKAWSDEV